MPRGLMEKVQLKLLLLLLLSMLFVIVVVFVVFFATVGAIVVWVTLLSEHRI